VDTAALNEEPVPGEGGAKEDGGKGENEVRLFVVTLVAAGDWRIMYMGENAHGAIDLHKVGILLRMPTQFLFYRVLQLGSGSKSSLISNNNF